MNMLQRNHMMMHLTQVMIPLISAAVFSAALIAAPQESPEMEESPVRKAFNAHDVSLVETVREARASNVQQEIEVSGQFRTEQPAPSRTARARERMPLTSPNYRGLFTPIPLKTWKEHDQITIVVLEASRVERSQALDTQKDWGLAFEAAAWTDFFNAGNLFTANGGNNLPRFEFVGAKDFDGEGDYGSEEEITFRTTATVLEVLPNGNLVLQARHTTKTDAETTVKTITGTVDPLHIAADDTLLHWRLYDLDLNIQNSGFVDDAATVGIIAQIVDAIFAF